MRDLLLLENQIPIFVLKELYNRVAPGFSILSLAREYFRDYDVQIQPSDDDNIVVRIDWQLSKHFTDLIRYLHIPLDFEYESKPDSAVLKSATKLREAGVSFQAVSNKFLLDIKFEEKPQKACFLLTQFRIQTGTERVLRNVMALEQCHYPDQTYICNYVSLLDDLVDIEADVDLLVENQIMVNELGSNREMATLVNSLCRELVINSNCYAQLIDQLNQHYDSYFNRTMATLKNVYFSDLWRGSSTVVGLAVLMFTFYNFFHPFFVKDDLNKPKLGLFNM
ncbi:hypothetical protein L6164_003582 [Bauhinia variegata]|nr:hypothetical protein L6164_003582 [Bauhinia variegata]